MANPTVLCLISGLYQSIECIPISFAVGIQEQYTTMPLSEYMFSGYFISVSSFIKSCVPSMQMLTNPEINTFI